MAGLVHGAALVGADAVPVVVEVDFLRRLPCVVIIGSVTSVVREASERVRSALKQSDIEFPRQRIVVNLSPGDFPKDGTAYDLAIAIGILAKAGVVDAARSREYLLVGELGLCAELRPVRGALAYACLARDEGFRGIILPGACAAEASLVSGLEVRGAGCLRDVVSFLNGELDLPACQPALESSTSSLLDFSDVRGQKLARVALEIAAAGGHNLLMEGPPGCGKTMLAARLPTILPRMTEREMLECTRIHSAAGLATPGRVAIQVRPFRAPHHSVSAAGLLGGASLRPGEVSLAHNGVLFLDEFAEFPRSVREALRGPLEDRRVVIARSGGHVVLPAAFMLVAASNPCPCGFLGHPTRPCTCVVSARENYRNRLSGPLMDRFDMRVGLAPVPPAEVLRGAAAESSAVVRARVEAARDRQRFRLGGDCACNAEISADRAIEMTAPTHAALALLQDEMEIGAHSARAARRLLKVARTIADLEGADDVHARHVARAVGLRCDLDMPGEP